jgi:hypothetical protein
MLRAPLLQMPRQVCSKLRTIGWYRQDGGLTRASKKLESFVAQRAPGSFVQVSLRVPALSSGIQQLHELRAA